MVLFAKPGDGESLVDEDVSRVWRSWGFVEESYWPGRSWTVTGLPGEDSVAPTAKASDEKRGRGG